jgi:hypothetical protein
MYYREKEQSFKHTTHIPFYHCDNLHFVNWPLLCLIVGDWFISVVSSREMFPTCLLNTAWLFFWGFIRMKEKNKMQYSSNNMKESYCCFYCVSFWNSICYSKGQWIYLTQFLMFWGMKMKLARNQFEYSLVLFNQRNLDKVTLCVMGRQNISY